MVTALYAGLLALLYMKVSLDVISSRRGHQISLGNGKSGEIEAIVSAHSNFAAYTAFLLFLTFLLETSGQFPTLLLHALAATFTLGRVLHFMAFRGERMNFQLRAFGMHMTLWPLLALGTLNVLSFFL